jgi:DNA-binding NarL/FixJ family response regulator
MTVICIVVTEPARTLDSWCRALMCAPGVQVSGAAGSIAEAEELPAAIGADVVIIAANLLAAQGAADVDRLRARFPSARVVVIGPVDAGEAIVGLVRTGIDGYIRADSGTRGLARALHSVGRGEVALPRTLVAPLIDALRADPSGWQKTRWVAWLSSRELDVLPGLLRGWSDAAIAAHLGVAESTVKSHVKRILRKAGRRSRFALAPARHRQDD